MSLRISLANDMNCTILAATLSADSGSIVMAECLARLDCEAEAQCGTDQTMPVVTDWISGELSIAFLP